MTEKSPLDEVRDPQTSSARLGQLATSHPELHVLIAAHPRAYPELLVWIEANGDPASRGVASQILLNVTDDGGAPACADRYRVDERAGCPRCT
ncbi:variant leucine-rich repeat-containing protein [Microbacterium aurum]